jgi:hypothetical protein
MHFIFTLLAATVCLVAVYVLNSIRYNRKYKLPPFVAGGVPLLGNALQLPPIGHEAGVVVKEWAEKYGEMYLPPPFLLVLTCVQVHGKTRGE